MASSIAARPALAELPVAMFLYTNTNTNNNIDATTAAATGLPSPVSLPLKRGPPSATAQQDPATLKRRGRVSTALGEDELGTGKSPARRLFPDTPNKDEPRLASTHGMSSPTPAHARELDLNPIRAHGNRNGDGAPSSPLSAPAPRRSARLASQTHKQDPPSSSSSLSSRSRTIASGSTSTSASLDASSSSSTNATASSSASLAILPGGHSMHDPGFVVFSDDDDLRARPRKPTAQRVFSPDEETENVPPAAETEAGSRVDLITAPNTGGSRRRLFERSKLGTQSVTASNSNNSSSPPRPPTGKEAMKLEAEGDEEDVADAMEPAGAV